MRPLRKNIAGQFFFFQAIKVADGLPFTGTAAGTVAKDGGNAAAIGGTVALVTGSSGMYRCAPSQADTNADFLGFNFTGSGMIAVVANMPTTALNPQDAVRGGQSALPNADANTQNGLGVLDVNGHLPSNVLAWGSEPGAVKVGGSSGLPDLNVMAWQDRSLGNTNMIEDDGSTNDRFTQKALEEGPIASTAGLALEATSQAIKTQTDKMLFNGSNYIRSHVETLEATALGSIAKNIWDYLETAITLAGSIGLKLKTNIDATISSRSTFNAASDTVTADLVNDAIKAATIEASAANKLADFKMRRLAANARTATYSGIDTIGFRSELGAVSKLVNRVQVSGAVFNIYDETDTGTPFGVQSLTTNATAEPIVEANTS